MRLVDANVLIYAVNTSASHHERSHAWLTRALAGSETILLPWISLLAFARLASHPQIAAPSLTSAQALEVVSGWLAHPNVVVPEPDDGHPRRMTDLLEATGGRGGNLVNDAFLAALALQYRATVVTFDSDFGRFPGVRWQLPESSAS